MKAPAAHPCATCPYRRDVPSGVWHPQEYAKLPGYDRPTMEQPAALFGCHQRDGRLCAGWVGCHDMDHSLALRFAAASMDDATLTAVLDYTTDVPLWGSGREAAAHGLAGVESPDARASAAIDRLVRKRAAG